MAKYRFKVLQQLLKLCKENYSEQILLKLTHSVRAQKPVDIRSLQSALAGGQERLGADRARLRRAVTIVLLVARSVHEMPAVGHARARLYGRVHPVGADRTVGLECALDADVRGTLILLQTHVARHAVKVHCARLFAHATQTARVAVEYADHGGARTEISFIDTQG